MVNLSKLVVNLSKIAVNLFGLMVTLTKLVCSLLVGFFGLAVALFGLVCSSFHLFISYVRAILYFIFLGFPLAVARRGSGSVSCVFARNERMIQFYLVLYGLLLACNLNELSPLQNFESLFFFLLFSIGYYIVVTRLTADDNRGIVNFLALGVGLMFSWSIIARLLAVKHLYIHFHVLSFLLNFSLTQFMDSFLLWVAFLVLSFLIFVSLIV